MIKNLSLLSISIILFLTLSNTVFAQNKKPKSVPNITSSEIWIDRFDSPTGKAITKGNWFTFNDGSNGGKSQIFPSEIKKAYKNIPVLNSMAFEFSYKLDKGNYQWEPYVGAGVSIIDSNISVNIENIKGIAYDYIGARHTVMFQLSSVKDYAHYKRMVPESEEWKTMVIPISEFRQPNAWGKPVEFDARLIEGLQWTIIGRTGDSGSLCIDNVRLLRKLPKQELFVPILFNPQPLKAEDTVILKEPSASSYHVEISEKVKIADWYGFSKAAYSLSFDDGLISQYKYVAPALDKLGLKATFYIVSETLESDSSRPASWRYGYWWQFIEMSKNGHELGSHSATHPKLTTFPDGSINKPGTLQYELSEPIKKLEEKIPGYKFITFAYPFVDFNKHVMDETSKLYVSSRGLGNGLNPVHPAKWMDIQAHCIDYSPNRTIDSDNAKMTTLKNWISDNTITKGGWTVYLAHDVLPFKEASTVADSWQPVSVESFEPFVQWLKEKQTSKELWIETVGNVTRYIKERDAASIIQIEETKDKLVFSITDNLPDDMFNYPITIEIKVPEGWKKVTVKQKSSKNSLTVFEQKIIVNVIPDKGNIEISKVE
jgi:hypothetical protein